MKVILLLSALLYAFTARADIHVIIYATCGGKTGHAGIAVDDYQIKISEVRTGGKTAYRKDTVATGFVQYFDLWPTNDEYKVSYDKDVEATYYRLPSNRWKRLLSVRTLAEEGLPHKEGYPCDGIITLPNSKAGDLELAAYLERKRDAGRPFNAMRYNCCDFVSEAIAFAARRQVFAKELVYKQLISTPNRLFRELRTWDGAQVVKDPGKKVDGSFFQERILGRMIPSFINF